MDAILAALQAFAPALRPFFPQLQRLLSQALCTASADDLAEDMEAVRTASTALSLLLPMLGRPEALVQDWAASLALPALDEADADEDTEADEVNVSRVPVHAKVMMIDCLSAALTQAPHELGSRLQDLQEPFMELLRLLAAHPVESVRHANSRLIDSLAAAEVIGAEDASALQKLSFMLK
jgi:hypothetical protein